MGNQTKDGQMNRHEPNIRTRKSASRENPGKLPTTLIVPNRMVKSSDHNKERE